MSALDLRELRNAFGTFMTGVTVVTAVDSNGTPVGFTANSYTSVSLEPPLLLVCPSNALSSFDIFNQCSQFAINILADDQQDISNVFSTSDIDRFGRISWRAHESGCPSIDGSAAFFSCSTHKRVVAGDHLILIGQVEHFETSGKAGLGYSNGGYFSLGLERRAAELPKPTRPVNVGAIIEHDGMILVEESPDGLGLPQVRATSKTGSLAAIRQYLLEIGLDLEFGPVYSIFESKRTGEYSTYYRAAAKDHDAHGLGRFVGVDEISSLSFASEALTTMMNRYVLERQHGVFCLYVGDEIEGDVHMFGEGLSL